MRLGGDRSYRQHAAFADHLCVLQSRSCDLIGLRTTKRQQAGKSSSGKGGLAGDKQNASPTP
jgi:hypothetical protein